VSPVIVVFAWSDDGAFVQVFWSSEYCHSYEAKLAELTEPARQELQERIKFHFTRTETNHEPPGRKGL
jgi:hypothetical protein